MVEVASFLAEDPQELVDASLACRMCLSGEVDWTLGGDGYDAFVRCRCRHCGDARDVYLTPAQALRLALVPAQG
ncbi:MAG TPA: hypothetical protein VHX88_07045 [Solirubrobacteraceae bacterium]|jgi:hypothetical protein|nr:hypothetical protein [Solirubrobacteraceae bacterium]